MLFDSFLFIASGRSPKAPVLGVAPVPLCKGVPTMLVLSRKKGERIRINHEIEVTVVELRNGQVKLGFVGPADIPIHREEVFQRIVSETAPAATSSW